MTRGLERAKAFGAAHSQFMRYIITFYVEGKYGTGWHWPRKNCFRASKERTPGDGWAVVGVPALPNRAVPSCNLSLTSGCFHFPPQQRRRRRRSRASPPCNFPFLLPAFPLLFSLTQLHFFFHCRLIDFCSFLRKIFLLIQGGF